MSGFDLLIKGPNKGPNVREGHGSAIQCLAEYAVATRFLDLPSDVVNHACRILLDTIGVILGGSSAPEVTLLAKRLAKQNDGQCTIIGHLLRSSALNAALVNGTAATWLDYDSGHRPPPGKPLLPAAHPPVHLVPAALAAGEMMGVSGMDILTALIVGYDVGARIGMGSRVRAEIHCHGTYHNIGAATAVARLKGFGREQMERTIAIATHLTLMPSFQNAYQGRTVRNTYSGVGAMVGVLASELTNIGFIPEHDAIGSVYGGIISPWLDPVRITEDLGHRYEITLGFIKRHPMCRMGQPALEAAEALVQKQSIDSDDIESVEVRTYDFAAKCNERAPKTELAAKFSIPWAVACMLVRKSAQISDFREQSLKDSKVKSVSSKVTVIEDSKYTSLAQDGIKKPASVTVRTKTGRTFYADVDQNSGGPESPLSMEQILNKFHSLADPVIGKKQGEKVVDMVLRLKEISNIHELTHLLIPDRAKNN